MTAGFQAFTDTGIVQIDGQTPNYQMTAQMRQATVVTSVPTVFNNVGTQFYVNFQSTTFTFNAAYPLFAFTADGGVMVTPYKFTRSGNTFTVQFVAGAATTINLFIFDQVPTSANRFGLQVFDANRVLIADAANPFARIIDVRSGQVIPGTGFDGTGTSMPGPGTQSVNYGRNVAVAGAYAGHLLNSDGSGGAWMTAWGVSGATVTWEWHAYYNDGGGHYVGFREASAWNFMVMDMTGII